MPSKKSALSQTVQLADRLDTHIRSMNLSPGDSFLSTVEASKFLGVAGGTANRALQLLEKRGRIARRQRRGSTVLATKTKSHFATIQFLFQKFYLRVEGFDFEEVLLGLQEEHPNTTIEQLFLDEGLEEQQTVEMIERNLKSDLPVGIVCVRAPFDILRLIEKSGLPAVMLGTRPVGIQTLPNLDRDHTEAIRLIHQFLRARNHRHAALLMRNHVLGGDVKTLDYFHRITDMQSSFTFVPSHDEAVGATVRQLLHSEQPPDAFICHTQRFAKKTLEALRGEKQDATVVLLGGHNRKGVADLVGLDAVVWDDLEQRQIGHRIGRTLNSQLGDKKYGDDIFPVHLRVYSHRPVL